MPDPNQGEKEMRIKMLAVLLLMSVFFVGCGKDRKRMPEDKIAITDRMEVIDGPVYVGTWYRSYIIKDTLTGKQYIVIGNSDCISVTPLEVAVEK